MKLYYSHYSPFSRKVRVVISELDLLGQVELNQIHPETYQNLTELNPLADVPVIVFDDQSRLFDSITICEFLGRLNPQNELYPQDQKAYFHQLKLQNIADGLVTYIDQIVHENEKPIDQVDKRLVEKSWKIIQNCLSYLQENFDKNDQTASIGNISVACILDYLGFHFRDGTFDWQSQYVGLATWFKTFKNRKSMQQTKYHSI